MTIRWSTAGARPLGGAPLFLLFTAILLAALRGPLLLFCRALIFTFAVDVLLVLSGTPWRMPFLWSLLICLGLSLRDLSRRLRLVVRSADAFGGERFARGEAVDGFRRVPGSDTIEVDSTAYRRVQG